MRVMSHPVGLCAALVLGCSSIAIAEEGRSRRDLILDFGNGDSIRLVGKGDHFRCDDPERSGIEKVETDTLVFADGTVVKLCKPAELAGTKPAQRPESGTAVKSEELPIEVKFAGVVESVSFLCVNDASCTMQVSGTNVLFGLGFAPGPWGRAFRLPKAGAEEYVGKKVLVYCRRFLRDERFRPPEPEKWCSLQGKSEYYIKLNE